MINVYRIRIEQRDNENFKRYYPEVARKIDDKVDENNLTYKNIEYPIDKIWYDDIQLAEKHIDRILESEKDHTIKIITYPYEK